MSDQPDALQQLHDKLLEGVSKKLNDHKEATEARLAEMKAQGIAKPEDEKAFEMLTKRLEGLEAELRRPDAGLPEMYKDVGEQFVESEDFKAFKNRGWHRGGAAFKTTDLFPGEHKTTITSSAVGSSTSGILSAQRVGGIVEKPTRALRIRDLIPVSKTTQSAIEYVQENAFTNAASPQAETSAKAESALTFTIARDQVRTIAHWIPAARQILDDLPALARYIRMRLLYGLKLKEETEILSGDNLGDHLNGLITRATAYAGTYVVAADSKIDTVRHAKLEVEIADEVADGIVLHPKDYHDIELVKDLTGGANTGNYIVGSPISGIRIPTLWGLPVVVSNSMPLGKFLVGAFGTQAEIFDRQEATIDISTEHSDYFVKNLVAVRAEERLALAVYRGGAFRYGSF